MVIVCKLIYKLYDLLEVHMLHYFRATNTIYQFHGCFYHGHTCLKGERDRIIYGRTLNKKFKATTKMSEDIRAAGFTLIEMWECEWRTFSQGLVITNPYEYPTEHLYRMSQNDIIRYILTDQMFCVIECDIHVPDQLKDKFSEMPPIFKNITVNFEDVGGYMQNYLESQGKPFKGRRYLVGSMFATKILLISPLVKWYLAKGLIIDKIYQVIEFKGAKCFESFVESVSNDRRAGDTDPAFQANADNSKTIGRAQFYKC